MAITDHNLDSPAARYTDVVIVEESYEEDQ